MKDETSKRIAHDEKTKNYPQKFNKSIEENNHTQSNLELQHEFASKRKEHKPKFKMH